MRRYGGWIAVLALAVGLTGCDAVEVVPATNDASATGAASTTVDSTSTTARASAATVSPATTTSAAASIQTTGEALEQSAVDGLLWMREEEKLARDVYQALSEMWDLPIFANIATSEQTHTDAVADLLGRYGIPDPMADDVAGVFEDPTIQGLYHDFVQQGSQSMVDALIVGATIEDLDIVDLQQRRSGVTAIDDVYARLEKGSRNHLRAFASTLERKGGEYSPSYLTLEEYEAIVTSPRERGRARG